MGGTRVRGKGQPEREIQNLFAALNQEQEREKHDLTGMYQGRLRSHAQNFESLKRKWQDLTGAPLPKKLRTSEPLDVVAPVGKENGVPNRQQQSSQPSVAEAAPPKPAAKTVVKKAKTNNTAAVAPAAATAVAVAVARPAKMPPHPDDKLNVDRMIVNELRKESRKRNLGTGGRKADLQARLRECLAEAKRKREAEWAAKWAAAAAAAPQKTEAEKPQTKHVRIGAAGSKGDGTSSKKGVEEMDVVMEDANEAEGVKPKQTKKVSVEQTMSYTKSEDSLESEPKEAVKPPTNNIKHAPKSALKPSKYVNSSNAHGTPQLESGKSMMPSSLAKGAVPNKVSETSTESSSNNPATSAVASSAAKSAKLQSSVKKTKISSTLAQTTPGGSAFKAGGAGSAKFQEKKKGLNAATAARKARLEAMRQKTKTNPASSATKPPSSHSKYAVSGPLKKMMTTPGGNKSNDIMAKMREKAAAEKNNENAVVAPAPTKPTKSVKPTTGGAKKVSQTAAASSKSAVKPPSSTALKSILDPANKPSPVKKVAKMPSPKKLKPLVEEKPLSPMQSYEMSDREADSDSESDSDEEYERQRPKKAVPEWAQKAKLYKALEHQFADGPDRMDPDKIFGEVLTCNLEEIFDKKKSRYHKRTSSGNWSKDHVSLAEKMTYKRNMGYGN